MCAICQKFTEKKITKMKIYSRLLWLAFISVVLVSCAKEETYTSRVPNATVDIEINLLLEHNFNNALYVKKYYSGQNGIAYAGYAGVMAITNEDASWLYAYDLCCPYEAPEKNEVQMSGSLKAKCPRCGSVFDLMNGGRAESGPATQIEEARRLKNYSVLRNTNYYRIYN